ncbi:MAG TPA: sigma factor, partial [bacterium]|nr:sigma factor [bacterium]
MDDRDTQFTAARPTLFAIAYRMVGTVMDAEDLVQDAYLRWREASVADVRSPAAYLTTIVTRLAINFLGSARVRRETYVG